MALWVALSTALLCALPSGGLPSSKTIGSAFDPATTSVAIRARASDRIAIMVLRDRTPDAGASSSGVPAGIAVALAILAPSYEARAGIFTPVASTTLPHPLIGIAHPRGPPTA